MKHVALHELHTSHTAQLTPNALPDSTPSHPTQEQVEVVKEVEKVKHEETPPVLLPSYTHTQTTPQEEEASQLAHGHPGEGYHAVQIVIDSVGEENDDVEREKGGNSCGESESVAKGPARVQASELLVVEEADLDELLSELNELPDESVHALTHTLSHTHTHAHRSTLATLCFSFSLCVPIYLLGWMKLIA